MVNLLYLLLLNVFISNPSAVKPAKCEISKIYQSEEISKEARVLTMNGSFAPATLLLQPLQLKPGEYEYALTRRATNLYKVEGTEIYIETKLCFNIGFKQKATIVINEDQGYIKGHVLFK